MFLRLLIELLFLVIFVAGVRMMTLRSKKKNMFFKHLSGLLLILADVLVLVCICYFARHAVRTINIPEGELHWSTSRPENARLCVPAAYSSRENEVLGQYILDDKVHGSLSPGKARVSIKNGIFYVEYKWFSGEGFQQHSLVVDSVPRHFTDKRYTIRRALCKKGSKQFILQSHLPMSLNSFARVCARKATNAVNLDMGDYAYGYHRVAGVKVPLTFWAWFNKDAQSNWLYVE